MEYVWEYENTIHSREGGSISYKLYQMGLVVVPGESCRLFAINNMRLFMYV